MATVVRQDVDSVNANLQITVTKDAYLPKVNAELKKIAQKATIKGFRQGKVPMDVVKGLYGMSILSDVINKELQDSMVDFMSTLKEQVLGMPISDKDSAAPSLSLKNPEDYTFHFKMGMIESFEVKGVDQSASLDFPVIESKDEVIDKEMDRLRKSAGTPELVNEPVGENDLVTVIGREMEGDTLKKDGWEATFDLSLEFMSEAAKAKILGLKQNEAFVHNVYELEDNRARKFIQKNLLMLTDQDIEEGVDVGEMYQMTIQGVKKVVPAEVDQAFLDKVFGEGKFTSEQEARDFMKSDIDAYLEGVGENLLFGYARRHLIDTHSIALPEGFLRDWINSREEREAPITDVELARLMEDLRWEAIRDKVLVAHNVTIEREDIKKQVIAQMSQMYGGQFPADLMNNLADHTMNDEKFEVDRYTNGAKNRKFIDLIPSLFKLNKKKVSEETFTELQKTFSEAENVRFGVQEEV